jgi:hypothetical protein
MNSLPSGGSSTPRNSASHEGGRTSVILGTTGTRADDSYFLDCHGITSNALRTEFPAASLNAEHSDSLQHVSD